MLKTIWAKLAARIALLSAFALLSIIITIFIASSQDSDSAVMNIAGRQRMLTQKITKEVLLAKDGKIPFAEAVESCRLFNTSLSALIKGSNQLNIPATENPEISIKLQELQAVWAVFQSKVDEMGIMDMTSWQFTDDMNFVLQNNSVILAKMNEIVGMYQAESQSHTRKMIYLQVLFALLTIVLFAYAMNRVKSEIVAPLADLRDVATKIAAGKTDFLLKVKSEDEIGKVRSSINGMIQNIRAAHEAVLTEKASVESKVQKAVEESRRQSMYLQEKATLMLQEMERFSKGDLTVELPVDGNDEVNRLFKGFNRAVANLQGMLRQVRESIDSTFTASAQISSSSEQMAAGASEQEMQSQEISAAVERMTQIIYESNDATNEVARKAKLAGQSAAEGGKIVAESIEGMNEIARVVQDAAKIIYELGKNSSRIEEIVRVINDIADQTNLLALNAAIEAARAGEQGRGFAVVADEVRKLADRTTKATGEIGQMIKKIQNDTSDAVASIEQGTEKVESGKHLAKKAENSLHQIIASSEEVLKQVTIVAQASESQTKAAEDISGSINHISTVTRETAIGIGELAKSSESLNRLTEEMHNLVNNFTVGEQRKGIKFLN
ncbi:MAG: methyl-accepting chemotaxis protein [Ignavibacteria bacterium]|nr:methyl-accepting chemotaxis protein [Ignavibacteria bacterium]